MKLDFVSAILPELPPDDVLALTRKHCVAISALGYYPNLLDRDEAVAKRSAAHLKKIIAAAPTKDLKNVNTFIGRDWTKSVEDMTGLSASRLRTTHSAKPLPAVSAG
jgi:sugar phosphate isomerase/epimerase